jgi:hypothetical protein
MDASSPTSKNCAMAKIPKRLPLYRIHNPQLMRTNTGTHTEGIYIYGKKNNEGREGREGLRCILKRGWQRGTRELIRTLKINKKFYKMIRIKVSTQK